MRYLNKPLVVHGFYFLFKIITLKIAITTNKIIPMLPIAEIVFTGISKLLPINAHIPNKTMELAHIFSPVFIISIFEFTFFNKNSTDVNKEKLNKKTRYLNR